MYARRKSLAAEANTVPQRKFHQPVFRRYTRGFTLTEVAIVLGVIGLLLTSIWSAASTIYENKKITNSETGIVAAAQAVHSVYWTSGDEFQGDGAHHDITFPGMFPTVWACVNGGTTYYQNPWTFGTCNGSYAAVTTFGIGPSSIVVIELGELDDTGCAALASYFGQSAGTLNGGQIAGLASLAVGPTFSSLDKPHAILGTPVWSPASNCTWGSTVGDTVQVYFDLSQM